MMKSNCPKCGLEGLSHYIKNPHYPYRRYLEFIHPTNNDHVRKRCYIGKSRTISEFIHSKNKPATIKEYHITFESLMTDLQKLVNGYSSKSRLSPKSVGLNIKEIVNRFGYDIYLK